jgi:hypothetical protein
MGFLVGYVSGILSLAILGPFAVWLATREPAEEAEEVEEAEADPGDRAIKTFLDGLGHKLSEDQAPIDKPRDPGTTRIGRVNYQRGTDSRRLVRGSGPAEKSGSHNHK